MLKLNHLLALAFILQTASTQTTSLKLARRSQLSAHAVDGKQRLDVEPARLKRRHVPLASEAVSSEAGFCRKRSIKEGDTSIILATSTTQAVEMGQVPPSSTLAACSLASGECLSTITTGIPLSTSFIDVTSTIFVTAVPVSVETSIPSSLSSSDPIEIGSVSSNVESATPTSTFPSTASMIPVTPTSTTAPLIPNADGCPAGSTWKRLTDDFNSFDDSRWKRELAADDQIAFGADGMIMKLTEQNPNIVFESKAKWIAPVTLTASIKSAGAGGIVNCAIFGQAGTDEIDLELIEGTYQVPMWSNGTRLEKDKDVTWTLADTSRELAPWVFDDSEVVVFSKLHDWSVLWDKNHLTWSVDGNTLLDVQRIEGGGWPDQPLPFRWGPWAAPEGWAGQLNWTISPEPTMQLKQVTIEGCQLDE